LIEVVVVSTPACHMCDEAERALEGLRREFPLWVRVVDIRSPEGARIFQEHQAPMLPVVLVSGRLFSAGRLPRKKLLRWLERAA